MNLGLSYQISEVVLSWETAYASAYQIQVSNDAINWTTIYSTTTGDGGVDDLTGLAGTGRYVRMYGTARGTPGGYSLRDFSVYGLPDISAPSNFAATAADGQVSLSWSGSTDLEGDLAGYRIYRNGVRITSTPDTTFTDTGLVDGTAYFYRVTAYDAAGNVSWPARAVATPSVNATTDPSGQPMPVGDQQGWHQVFADDFPTAGPTGGFSGCVAGLGLMNDYCAGLFGTPYFRSWFAYPDGWSDTGSGTYYPSQSVSIHDGLLDYYLHSAPIDGVAYHMIDAAVPKIRGGVNGGGLLYGRYVVRARWDALSSYHISFLLWPDSDNWPGDGEIDFPEANMASADVSAFMHWQNATSGSQQDAYDNDVVPWQWHTYEIDWLPTGVSFYVDGQLIDQSTSNIPDTPMHWVLQTNSSSSMTPGDTQAGHVQVDWAVAYTPS